MGWYPRHQVLHKYSKLVVAGNCPGNIPMSDIVRALEDSQLSLYEPRMLRLSHASEPRKLCHRTRAVGLQPQAGLCLCGTLLGEVLVGKLGMLAAVSRCSCEPARAARAGSGAVLSRVGRTCVCLVAIALGRNFIP